MDYEQLKKHIARNLSRDEADPLKTYIPERTREDDIGAWLALAATANDEEDKALALASLIAEQSKMKPEDALLTWETNKELILRNRRARAVAYWGLARAYENLDQPLRAYSYYGAGGREFSDLQVEEGDELAGLATTSSDGRDVQFRDKPLPKFAVELKGREHFGQWLRGRETLDASKLGARFGGYTTNDVEFVRSAKDRLQTLLWELREPLLRPANYLLEAAPGSGKSFFVGEFARELQANLNRDALYIEKNLSAYPSIDAAFTDIVLDVLLGLASRRDIVLFLDEVDTEIDGRRIFQKLIAPINGERFFFQEKQLSFGKQNVVGFYALSSGRDDLHHAPKWPDFLSRIPAGHRFELPAFDSPFERLFRALGILRRGRVKVERATVHALMYLSLREWRSSRELDQGIELAKARLRDPTKVLDLEHVALSLADVREVSVRANVSIAHEVNDVISIVG